MAQEPKTRPTTQPVAEFLAGLAPERRADCERVKAWMEAASGHKAEMWGTAIVGCGRYMAPCGPKFFEWPRIGFSPRKQDLVLYLSGLEDEGEALARLGKHRIGVACLYLKRLSDHDEQVLLGLIARSIERTNRNHPPA